jgi:polyisoprenoid-binding protein YceI
MKHLMYIFLFVWPGTLLCQTDSAYRVDPAAQNKVTVTGSTPLHEFEGTTRSVSGTLTLHSTTYDRAEFYFVLTLDSLDTGIKARDNKMRTDVLETKQYPTAVYKGSILRTLSQTDSVTEVATTGELTLHGVTKPCALNVEIVEQSHHLKVNSMMHLKLTDYKMERPSILFIKVNDMVAISVELNLQKANQNTK